MPNTRFTFLLESTPLSSEDKYNLGIIFDALRDERKLDIINNWNKYVEKIILLQHLADAERNRLIQETFQKINTLIDEAYLRDQSNKTKRKLQEEEARKNQESANIYDHERQRKNIIEEQRSRELERAEQMDPLAFL